MLFDRAVPYPPPVDDLSLFFVEPGDDMAFLLFGFPDKFWLAALLHIEEDLLEQGNWN